MQSTFLVFLARLPSNWATTLAKLLGLDKKIALRVFPGIQQFMASFRIKPDTKNLNIIHSEPQISALDILYLQ